MSDDCLILDEGWLEQVEQKTCAWLERLRVQPGRYKPCEEGATEIGLAMGLGFSTLALRTLRLFGRWDGLPQAEREAWIRFLQDYQEPGGEGAFVDPPEMQFATRELTLGERVIRRLRRLPPRTPSRSVLLAETKQAVATLHEVGATARRPFTGFPHDAAEVRAWLEGLNWNRPWSAGGQSATLVVFLKTEAPRLRPAAEVEAALSVCREFFASIADPETGAYFRGPRPEHGELMNGAMKVLMSLDWLEVRPHHPERLAATCQRALPSPRGCHLVDAIHILHQCATGPADEATRRFCLQVLEMVRAHEGPRGGFSFYAGKAQTSYYGVPITRGRNEGDVHGTCLLVWALAMIWRLVAPESARGGVCCGLETRPGGVFAAG